MLSESNARRLLYKNDGEGGRRALENEENMEGMGSEEGRGAERTSITMMTTPKTVRQVLIDSG